MAAGPAGLMNLKTMPESVKMKQETADEI